MSHRRFSSTFGIRSSRFTAWTHSAGRGCSRRCRGSGSTRTRQSPTSWGSGSQSHAGWTLTITPWMLKRASFKLEAVSRRKTEGTVLSWFMLIKPRKGNNIPPAYQKQNKLTNRTLNLKIRVLRTKPGHLSKYFSSRLWHSRDSDLCVSLHLRQRSPEVTPALPPHRESPGQVQSDGPSLRNLRRLWNPN